MRLALLLLCILLSSCSKQNRLETATLVLGSWYGFYPFYYAHELGLDEQYGLQLKVLEPTNIGNLRRSYLREQVDFAATSTLEFTNAVAFSGLNLKPVLFTDYSNGGDVIIASKTIENTAGLYNKRIAVPSKGIGEFILTLVFESKEPKQFFEQINIYETECNTAFKANFIDACVTYPPISTYLLENENLHQIYSSEEHPYQILDLIWSKPSVEQEKVDMLRNIWFAVIERIKSDPNQYYEFVAKITNTSVSSVESTMQGIELLGSEEHSKIFNEPTVYVEKFVNVCILIRDENCDRFKDAFSW